MVIRDKNYYVCKTKRPYPWFWAHVRKYRKYEQVRLSVYRCPWCHEYHISKQPKQRTEGFLRWIGTNYPRQYV
jgi:hypothetical protein